MSRRITGGNRALREAGLLEAVFELVEQYTKAELTNAGRKLLIDYYLTSAAATAAGKARGAVRRYAQWDPPSMDDIRERHRAGAMNDLDWRVLKVENVARKLASAVPEALRSSRREPP